MAFNPYECGTILVNGYYVVKFIRNDDLITKILWIDRDYYIDVVKNRIEVNKGIKYLMEDIIKFIKRAGCYILTCEDDEKLCYIGETKGLKGRLYDHFGGKKYEKFKKYTNIYLISTWAGGGISNTDVRKGLEAKLIKKARKCNIFKVNQNQPKKKHLEPEQKKSINDFMVEIIQTLKLLNVNLLQKTLFLPSLTLPSLIPSESIPEEITDDWQVFKFDSIYNIDSVNEIKIRRNEIKKDDWIFRTRKFGLKTVIYIRPKDAVYYDRKEFERRRARTKGYTREEYERQKAIDKAEQKKILITKNI